MTLGRQKCKFHYEVQTVGDKYFTEVRNKAYTYLYLSIYTNTKSGKIAQSCLEKISINEFPIRFGVDSNSKIHFGDQTPPHFP